MNKREKAIETLIENARAMSNEHKNEVLNWKPVKIQTAGDGYLPGYIPYIGKNYFSAEPRILFYALSQNIKSSDSFAKNWAEPANIEWALDRQNISFEKKGIIEMYPFDTGHLPVIAAMLLCQVGIQTNKLDSIYDLVSATNLSKFSFRKNQNRNTTDSKESLDKCFDWFSIREIEVLKPDYIICAGNWVYNTITKNIKRISFDDRNIIKVAFPSLQVINRSHKKLRNSNQKNKNAILDMIPAADHYKVVAYQGKKLKDVIERDYIYFSNMYLEIER
jgi:hypothetical protein